MGETKVPKLVQENLLNGEYVGYCENETHVERKGADINADTFGYKGCWNCPWFELNTELYMYVKEASEKYGVSETTIRRWCNNKKLNAKLCVRIRYDESNCFFGSNKIWLIKKARK